MQTKPTPTNTFAAVATGYCAWLEEKSKAGGKQQTIREDWLAMLQKHLCALQIAVLDLPVVDPEHDGSLPPLSGSYRADLHRGLGWLPFDMYWDVFDPLDFDEIEPVCHSLIDDLADIYQDVKEALVAYEKGDVQDASWHWRFSHRAHWGAHLTSALRAIHNYFAHHADWGGI